MRIALVHDYIGEFGGAERVLEALSEIYPKAPIYTAFTRPGPALARFAGKKIIVSWAHYIPFFASRLHSPLRFLAPLIWKSFDFSTYDVVVSSASWFVTKGFGSREKGKGKRGRPIEICYCHTPPRWLYGYETPYASKNTLVRAYVALVAHFIRMYDFWAAQRVDYFIANSKNVQARIKKFYRRDAVVIYPPIDVGTWHLPCRQAGVARGTKPRNYYFFPSRITGGKGLELAVEAVNKLKIPLKISGLPSGYSQTYEWIKKNAGPTVELLGYVDDTELAEVYSGAKAVFALEKDVDFGMTPVEAMAVGTPVIAYNGGGYRESVTDKEKDKGGTGVFFDDYSVDGLIDAIKRFEKLKIDPKACIKQAEKFSKERFKRRIKEFVEKKAGLYDGL